MGNAAAAPRTPTLVPRTVCLTVKPIGEPDAGNPHVRFDERGWETERCRMAQATAPILDSTEATDITALNLQSLLGVLRTWLDLRPLVSWSKMTRSRH